MVEAAARLLGCDQEQLLDELRAVHQKHHNSEHPFALLETNLIKNWLHSGHGVFELDAVFQTFNSERKRRLVPYSDVHKTLSALKDRRVRLIAHSDSNRFGVIDRITRLQLVDYFDAVYCVEGSSEKHPRGGPFSPRYKNFPWQKMHLLGHHEKKPNPGVLNHIIAESAVDGGRVAYIGDSIAKDIAMARSSGVYAIWAEYGTQVSPALYQQLVRISHWTAEDVQRENATRLAAAETQPDFTCHSSFHEVLGAIDRLMTTDEAVFYRYRDFKSKDGFTR
jgi:phosphoglycolate phosphatase